MKKFTTGYCFLIACLIACYGCAGIKAERRVQDNIFYSSSCPKIKIRINPDFRYMGTYKKTRIGGNLPQGSSLESNFYLFCDIGGNNIVHKSVEIVFHELSSGLWLPDLFSYLKPTFDARTVKIGGEIYQHALKASKNFFGKREKEIIYEKGHIISNCYLMRGLASIVTRSEDTKMYIYYIEDIAHGRNSKYGCDEWCDENVFSEDQRQLIRDFLRKSEEDIQILAH